MRICSVSSISYSYLPRLQSDGKKTKEKEKINLMVEKLKEEQQKQLDHVTRVMYRLKSESKHWFPNKTAKSECIVRMQQFCLYQRCLFSASDAVFCALFIKIIHSLQAVNFSTILCFDRVSVELPRMHLLVLCELPGLNA